MSFFHILQYYFMSEKSRYVIDKTILFEELPVANNAKGRYNVFYAFAVEYICIICDLLRAGDITKETFLLIKKDNFELVSNLYLDYILMHKKCSYDLAGYKSYLKYFTHIEVSKLKRGSN